MPGLSMGPREYELLQRLPGDIKTDTQITYGIDDVGRGDSRVVRRERLVRAVLCRAVNNGQSDDIAIGRDDGAAAVSGPGYGGIQKQRTAVEGGDRGIRHSALLHGD